MKYKNKKILFFGFTIVELLVVIAVITILMALITSAGTTARARAKIYQAKTMIASLETALSMYHVDFGDYPGSVAGNQDLINLLSDTATYSGNLDWQGPYISFKEGEFSGVIPNASLIDPWGNDYNYTYDSHTDRDYKILSYGPNGEDDSGFGDDIKSW